MYFELKCVDGIFYGEYFSIFREKYTVIYKNLFLKSRIIWMLLRKFKLEIMMNVRRFSFLYSQNIKGK